ncbi:MAG: glycosyltransferase [Clostridia bacterium]|nr:glycosyltransferase [Clostridia bacterium]
MRVLQVNAVYGVGSTGTIVKDISDMLIQNGAESYVAYQTALTTPQNGFRIGNKLDWKLHALLSRVFGKQAYFSKRATKKFLKWVEKIKPDVVHLHNLHSNYINLNMLLAYLAKEDIPTVITLHDCWYFTGKCFHYIDVNCERFKNGCGKCPKKKEAPCSFFRDASASVLKDRENLFSKIRRLKIVGCSQWICDEAKKGIFKDFDIWRIYNGVDTEIFKPKDVDVLRNNYDFKDAFVVLGMANKWLLPANRDLLKAISKTLDKKNKLLLIGCSEKEKKFLKTLNENIIPIGYIQNRKILAGHYNLADVFVNVTHADTSPTVNMESICCGTQVITYASCGSPELVLEGCGIVVQEGDVEGVIRAIERVRTGGTVDCSSKGKEAFNKKENYKKYLNVYRTI